MSGLAGCGGRARAAGFTLLEVLVALALSALLMALLAQAIASLRGRSSLASEEAAASQERRAGEQTLAMLLSSAMPAASPGGASTFTGTAKTMEFLAAPPQALAAQGALKVRLTVSPTTASQVGIYAETAPHDARGPAGAALSDRQLLVAGLTSASFEYAARADVAMRPDWPAGGRPPALVRLRLARGNFSEPKTEDMIVAIRRQQTGGCRVDPISLNCRAADAS